MGKELRCPACDRVVPPESLTYSEALADFVCRDCKTRALAGDVPNNRSRDVTPGRVKVPPPPTFIDSPASPAAATPDVQPKPEAIRAQPKAVEQPKRSHTTVIIISVILAALVTT